MSFLSAPEHGILLQRSANVLNDKMRMAVGKMWHNISAGNVLVGMVTQKYFVWRSAENTATYTFSAKRTIYRTFE
jgi:hypothetical protein